MSRYHRFDRGSNLKVQVDGEEHVARVEEKAQARETYDSAIEVSLDSGLGWVLPSDRGGDWCWHRQ